MKNIVYKLTDFEGGQCAEGTAAVLSELTGIRTYQISRLAKEDCIYQGCYYVQKLQGETKKGKQDIIFLEAMGCDA